MGQRPGAADPHFEGHGYLMLSDVILYTCFHICHLSQIYFLVILSLFQHE